MQHTPSRRDLYRFAVTGVTGVAVAASLVATGWVAGMAATRQQQVVAQQDLADQARSLQRTEARTAASTARRAREELRHTLRVAQTGAPPESSVGSDSQASAAGDTGSTPTTSTLGTASTSGLTLAGAAGLLRRVPRVGPDPRPAATNPPFVAARHLSVVRTTG